MHATPAFDAYAVGWVDLADLTDAEWNSLASEDTVSLATAGGGPPPAGLVVAGLSIYITAGSVGFRFTGATDPGAAGDAAGDYPATAVSMSLPIRGPRDLSASPSEQLTRVSLRPNAATGYAIIYYDGPPRT